MDILVKHTNDNSYSVVSRKHMKSAAALYNKHKAKGINIPDRNHIFHITVRLLALAGF